MPDLDRFAGGEEHGTAPPAECVRKPKFWFEVEDFLRHFDGARHVTGIQRVCIEIFTEVERLYGMTDRIGFCRVNLKTQMFEEVEFSEIAEAYLRPPAERGVFENFAQWVERKLRRVRRARFLKPGDVVICLGACWINSRYNRCIQAAKRDYRIRFVLLVHDLIPLTHASFVDRDHAERFSSWLPAALANADFALTVSWHSRDELIKMAKVHAWALPVVEVLPLGATFNQRRLLKTAAISSADEGLPERFVLYVSTIEPRKNHRLLVGVWRRLIAQHGADFTPDLVWVGRFANPDPASAFRKELLSDQLGGKLRLLINLSDEELAEAYRRCLFTVYPSLCEGWGLPVAESLAHGRLCVASDRTSLPEVGGKFVDYFNPGDIEDAVAKIERPLVDPEYLAAREALSRDAYRPASWSDCARSLVGLLDRAAAGAFSQEVRG